jgi:TP901 family phage tail tape measure protein
VAYDVLVRFRATVEQFTGPVGTARANVQALKKDLDEQQSTLEKNRATVGKYDQAWRSTSTSLLAMGAAVGVVVAGAAMAAVQWETAWTGVAKTVNGTAAEMAGLEGDLQALARTLPVSATEIARVAENAGQLGVKASDIAEFTRVMIGLGEATNLTSDEASTALAQIANIMGVTGDGIARMASTIVALGNNGASTERDITSLSTRIAASGKLVGLTTDEVLSFASALTSVGVEAEAGGTALSQTFTTVRNTVDAGGEALKTMAATAGMTGEQFTKVFKHDASSAIAAFITGLGEVEKSGTSASIILDQLGMVGVRQQTALLSLAAAGSLLTDQLDIGSAAWQQNSALAAETARRYATTESQMKIAMNNIQQSGADMGKALLPMLSGASTEVVKLARAFSSMSDPAKAALVTTAATAAGVLLLAGGTMKAVVAVSEFRAAMTALGAGSLVTAGGVGKLTLRVAELTAAVALYQTYAASASKELQGTVTTADNLAASIGQARNSADMVNLNSSFNFDEGWLIKTKVDGLGDSLRMALEPSFFDSVSKAMNGTGSVVSRVEGQFDQLDKSLAALRSSGNVQAAAAAFKQVAETKVHYDPTWTQGARDETIATEKLITLFPQYKAQLDNVASGLKVTGLSAQDYVGWMGGKVPAAIERATTVNPGLMSAMDEQQLALLGTAGAAQSAANAIRAQVEATRAMYNATIETSGSLVGLHQAEADAAEQAALATKGTAKERAAMAAALNATKTAFNLDTEAGRANQRALDSLGAAHLSTIEKMEKSGVAIAKQNEATQEARDRFIAAAKAMGITDAAAIALADSYGLIPKKVDTAVTAPNAPIVIKNAQDLKAALANLPPKTAADVMSVWQRYGYDAAVGAMNKLDGTHYYVYVNTVYDPVAGSLAQTRGNRNPGKATGSWVSGPGTGTSDEAGLYWLSNREFIMRASSATAIETKSPGLLEYMNAFGTLPGLASGGSPGYTYAPASALSPSLGPTYVDSSTHLTFGGIEVVASSPDDALRKLTDTLRARLAGAGVR